MATTAGTESGAPPAQFLTFRLGDEEYGVGILQAKEIIEYDAVTRVPNAPPFVRGVINLRGSVVPVVDLAVKFGGTPGPVTRRTCIVIVEVAGVDGTDGDGQIVGIVADGVSQVMELAADQIEPPPAFGTTVRVEYLAGLGKAGKWFVLLLNVDRLLSQTELTTTRALAAAEAPGA